MDDSSSSSAPGVDGAAEAPTLVLVAFGTSVPAAQAALEAVDTAVRKAWPSWRVLWAFSSNVITKKLRRQGRTTLFARATPLRTLPEIYALLRDEGVREVVVQSLHISPGAEYQKILAIPAPGLEVRYGQPLLADDAAIEVFLAALAPQFGDADAVTILCGHGNDRESEHNAALLSLDRLVRQRYERVYVATVEGQPGTEEPLAVARAAGGERVVFVPLMMVAGDHLLNDVMGDESESWRHQLGLPAELRPPLGLQPAILPLWLERIRAALAPA